MGAASRGGASPVPAALASDGRPAARSANSNRIGNSIGNSKGGAGTGVFGCKIGKIRL